MNFPVRLIHEDHGAMHVYDRAELDKHLARGWEIEGAKPPPVAVTPAAEREEVAPVKRGRPRKVNA
jgi:hypothetical protein